MKTFECQHCRQLLYFENTSCMSCGRRLGYLPEIAKLSALEPDGDAWRALAEPEPRWRFCANAEYDACNWLLPADAAESLCRACRHNRTVPDLGDAQNRLRWQRLERAKHHLFYSLLRFRLPLRTRDEAPEDGLAFDFLAETAAEKKVTTGHANGVITINVAEADDAERERMRGELGEPYRTILGHFRHEIGHYYWERLVRDRGRIDAFRAAFGDESQDYATAIAAHYQNGPRADWRDSFISSYASAHPWEDFAETWAHTFHIVDTLETARACGMELHPKLRGRLPLDAEVDFDPYRAQELDWLIEAWLPLTVAVNSLNRSMGQPDLYPFVLTPPVISKLRFVHELLRG
jgi:hypothetical protein